jgi:ribulose-phosphate 3-epimerase
MASGNVLIGPSILSADFLNLGDQIQEAEAADVDYIHVDVMDGRFVPNISVGLPIVEAVRRTTSLPIDVHLMIVEPERYARSFVEAGADAVTVHVEATAHLHRTLQAISESGAVAGVTLNPATPLAMVEEVLALADQILVMSVNPGFGGQQFIPSALERVQRLQKMIAHRESDTVIQVDGGINASNIGGVVAAGASKIVAGSAIFGSGRPVKDAVAALRQGITSAPSA